MFRFLIVLAVLGTFVGVVVGGLGIAGVIDMSDSGCPYGYGDSPSSSASSSCKSRPEPKPAQTAAVLDGSALANGLAAFKASKEAGAEVVGVGLNAYGETTFTIPDGKNAFGAPEQRHVTFDRTGAAAPADNAFRRRYATSTSSERVAVGDVRPGAVKTALARVRRGAPNATLTSAVFARKTAGAGIGWTLQFSTGYVVQMDSDGTGLCVFGANVRGVKPCGLEQFGGGSPSRSAPSPAPKNEQLDCIQRAAGDVVEMQECVTG